MRGTIFKEHIPKHVAEVLEGLVSRGHTAYLVGGACRDLLMGEKPKDWDVATSATPQEIRDGFPGIPRGEAGIAFGTIVLCMSDGPVEVTTFRSEGLYSDSRRPDWVNFLGSIREDLARRDFTVNAIAWGWPDGRVKDPFNGRSDLKRRVIRAVGEPSQRLREDPLRMMRALRFTSRGWRLENKTASAIENCSYLLARVAQERIRDEFSQVLLGKHAAKALWQMVEMRLMENVIHELEEARRLTRVRGPFENVLEHSIATVHYLRPDVGLRLAGLLHDVAKPRTFTTQGGTDHFHGHAKVGAAMAEEALRRLRFDTCTLERVSTLVREHMFHAGPDLSDSGIRRLIRRVGRENIMDLFELRQADILASGGLPGRILEENKRRAKAILENREPLESRELAVDGFDVMEALDIPQGPRVGRVLETLLEMVLEDPSANNRAFLLAILEKMAQRKGY